MSGSCATYDILGRTQRRRCQSRIQISEWRSYQRVHDFLTVTTKISGRRRLIWWRRLQVEDSIQKEQSNVSPHSSSETQR